MEKPANPDRRADRLGRAATLSPWPASLDPHRTHTVKDLGVGPMQLIRDAVPRDMITFIDGKVYSDGLTQHCFVKQNRAVVVQTVFLPHRTSHLASSLATTSDAEYFDRHVKATYETLELIVSSRS